MKYLVLLFFLFCICLFGSVCLSRNAFAEKITLKVFHAGSLSVPFAKMEEAFEKKYPYIDVQRESSGSVRAVRKVIELHKPCDVVAVADYTLIPKMMFPKYADHVKLFAKNELVLCFTKDSKYANEINSNNWYEILTKPGVKFGFSNPNEDPCGYRTVISIGLASLHYKNPAILENLLGKNTNIKWKKTEDGLLFIAPKELKINTEKLIIRPKEVDLVALLESGAIDYLFLYKSVVLQHHLKYIELPEAINLSSIKEKDFYAKSKIRLANGKLIKGKPIVYGIAALKTAPHPKEAKLWEDFVTGKEGKEILEKCYQTPIFPAEEIKAE
ncbi:tungstate ABC transporter substrate-binding protein WtpA [Thermodesulfatator indicus]